MSLNRPIYKLRNWIDSEKLDWSCLSLNPAAIKLLTENKDKINWSMLSQNKEAIQLLSDNPDKINYNFLSENLGAIELLSNNPDKIVWHLFSRNPSAIKILEENCDKISWNDLSLNSAIFELDYKAMKIANEKIEEELIKEVMKPSRIFKYYNDYNYDYLEELFGD